MAACAPSAVDCGYGARVGSSEERAARNELLFREVNTQIEKLEERMGPAPTYPLICECSRADCAVTLYVAREVYHVVRSSQLRFFIAPGHEQPEVEHVVERRPGYTIVEKFGVAAGVVSDES